MKKTTMRSIVAAALLLSLRFTSHGDGTIEVLTPTAGEEFHVGDTLTVTWRINAEQGPDGGGVAVLVSPTDGKNWLRIVGELIANDDPAYYQDGIGTYHWVIRDSLQLYIGFSLSLSSETCKAMVGAPYDESFVPGESEIFAIRPAPTAVSLPAVPSVDRTVIAGTEHVRVFSLDGRSLLVRSGRYPGALQPPSPGAYVGRSSSRGATTIRMTINQP